MPSAAGLLELWRKVQERHAIVSDALDFQQDETAKLEVASYARLRLTIDDLQQALDELRAAI